jgi:hypothetical protein
LIGKKSGGSFLLLECEIKYSEPFIFEGETGKFFIASLNLFIHRKIFNKNSIRKKRKRKNTLISKHKEIN